MQIQILANVQNGRDTRVRQARVYSPIVLPFGPRDAYTDASAWRTFDILR